MGVLVCFIAGTDLNLAPAEHVDATLVSVPWCIKTKSSIKNTLKLFEILKTKYRMLDSGGFQIYKIENKKPEIIYKNGKPEAVLNRDQIVYEPHKDVYQKNKFNLTPFHTVETAQALGADFMHSLDYPLPHSKVPGEQKYQFMRAAYYNAKNAETTGLLRERVCPDVKFLLPVQAYTLRQFDEFMGLVGTKVIIDGPSLPIRNHDIADVCLFLVRFYQMDFRTVHILGTSKFWLIAVLAYFARNYFDFSSFDACSWRDAARVEEYLEPYTLYPITIKDNNLNLAKMDIKCECPWCSYKSSFLDILDQPYDDKFSFLRRHNWWVINQATREFHDHAASPLTLKNFLMEKAWKRKKEIDELFRCLLIVDININRRIEVLKAMLKKSERI